MRQKATSISASESPVVSSGIGVMDGDGAGVIFVVGVIVAVGAMVIAGVLVAVGASYNFV